MIYVASGFLAAWGLYAAWKLIWYRYRVVKPMQMSLTHASAYCIYMTHVTHSMNSELAAMTRKHEMDSYDATRVQAMKDQIDAAYADLIANSPLLAAVGKGQANVP